MAQLEDLLAAYPAAPSAGRKFIICELTELASGAASEDVIELIWGEHSAQESRVRRQARFALGRLLPRVTRERVGVTAEDVASGTSHRRTLAATGVYLSGPVSEVHRILREGVPALRTAATLVLGRVWTRAVQQEMSAELAQGRLHFAGACALAEMGGPSAFEAVRTGIERIGHAHPDLYVLLRGFPGEETVAFLARDEARTDLHGRANIALALAGQPFAAGAPVFEKLLERQEGWVTAHVMQTLGVLGDRAALPLVRRTLEREKHPFVRLQAARAAAEIPGNEAVELLIELAARDDVTQAAALEGLAERTPLPAGLPQLARDLSGSSSVRTRVAARLIVARTDAESAGQVLAELVAGDDPAMRLEATRLLGHVGGPTAARLLGRMSLEDPAPHVRVAALRTLACFESTHALPVLGGLFDSPPAVQVQVARALTYAPAPGDYIELVEATVRRAPAGGGRAGLVRALGLLAARAGLPAAPALVVEGLGSSDVTTLIGTLEALEWSGDAVSADDVVRLVAHEDPRVSSRAALVSLGAGRPEQLYRLGELLATDDPAVQLRALETLLKVGLLLPLAEATGRFGRLLASVEGAPVPEGGLVFSLTANTSDRRAGPTGVPDLKELLANAARKALEKQGAALGQSYQPAGYRAQGEPVAPVVELEVPVLSDSPSMQVPLPVAKPVKRETRPTARVAGGGTRTLQPVALFLVLVAGGWMFANRAPREAEAPAAAQLSSQTTGFRVFGLEGAVEGNGPAGAAAPLRIGQAIDAGSEVRTGASAKLTLVNRAGSRITVGPGSRLAAAVPTGTERGTQSAVRGLDGDIEIESRTESAFEVLGEGVVVVLVNGAARVTAGQLKVEAGIALVRQGKATRTAAAGETVGLK